MSGEIQLEELTKAFDAHVAVAGIDLDMPAGEFFTLLGPSGCGKTTTLRMIAGFERPTSGRILLDGSDVARVPPHQRNVNTVFQSYALFPHLNVAKNVAFGLKYHKLDREERRTRVAEALELVNLTEYAHRKADQLSGGQQQRVALARALVLRPRVLLLDEPLGALDANVRADLRTWLRRLHDDMHVTSVLVTHDQEEAMDIADRIAVMDHGRIAQVGAPRELYDRPADAFVMGFLGPVSKLGGALVRPHDIRLSGEPVDGGVEAMVARVVHLGFEVRVELVLGDGEPLAVQLTRTEAEELEIASGDIVYAHTFGPVQLGA
jgi:sulfate transport system ATP-binding protein